MRGGATSYSYDSSKFQLLNSPIQIQKQKQKQMQILVIGFWLNELQKYCKIEPLLPGGCFSAP